MYLNILLLFLDELFCTARVECNVFKCLNCLSPLSTGFVSELFTSKPFFLNKKRNMLSGAGQGSG